MRFGIQFFTPLRPICWTMGMIFGRSKSCWATRTWARRWSTRTS